MKIDVRLVPILRSRRSFLATAAGAGSLGILPAALLANEAGSDAGRRKEKNMNAESVENAALRPFRVAIPDDAIADLRRRIAATRWPPRETVNDRSQGARLAKIQPLVRYWGGEYDWRKVESRLNALPQYITTCRRKRRRPSLRR
jgi:hypothetical protein